jgi:hypothetical protein
MFASVHKSLELPPAETARVMIRSARVRHRAELAEFRKRLVDLMAVPHDEHLQPVEEWLPLVRKHIIDGTVD